MINPKEKRYILDEFINLTNEDVIVYLKNNQSKKDIFIYALFAISYYNQINSLKIIINNIELNQKEYGKLLFYVVEKGLEFEKFKYFLSKLKNKLELEFVIDIITESKESSSYDIIKYLLNSDKIEYSENIEENIDFVNHIMLYEVEESFEVIKDNKFIINILLNYVEEMENKKDIKKCLLKNNLENF